MKTTDKKTILITLPDLSAKGGVSSFWNALFLEFAQFDDIDFVPLYIGGHKYNAFGPILDQLHFKQKAKSTPNLAFLNPSLLVKSFFRDSMFAKQLIRKKIPFVVFFHGWELDFEKKVDKYYKKFFMNTFGRAEKIFVLSEDFKNKIYEWGYRNEIIVETTNVNASLIKNFSLAERINKIKNSDTIKLLFLARIVKNKGVFETVEAFEKIENRTNLELTIAGDGEDFNALKKRVENNSSIKLTGYIEGEEKSQLFKESDIYCFPTYYGEGLPTSVLEAMAFGLPVITTDVGGLKHFFKDKQMGYLVEPKNREDLIEKIERLRNDKVSMMEISKFNFDYAQKYLTNRVVAQRLYQHLNESFQAMVDS